MVRRAARHLAREHSSAAVARVCGAIAADVKRHEAAYTGITARRISAAARELRRDRGRRAVRAVEQAPGGRRRAHGRIPGSPPRACEPPAASWRSTAAPCVELEPSSLALLSSHLIVATKDFFAGNRAPRQVPRQAKERGFISLQNLIVHVLLAETIIHVSKTTTPPDPPAQYLGGAHRGRVCARAFIGVSVCACM